MPTRPVWRPCKDPFLSVVQFFPGYGWFTGVVTEFNAQLGYYNVEYEDGDEEEYDD